MSQIQDNQPPQKERLLQQVHPPPKGDDAAASPGRSQSTNQPEVERIVPVLTQDEDHWEGSYRLTSGETVAFQAHRVGQQVHLWIAGELYIFSPLTPTSRGRAFQQIATDEILCSVPGVVLAVHVTEGDTVAAGQDLLVIESMKTEQVVKSPRDGTVQRVPVQAGDRVERGMRLVVLVPLDAK